MTYDVNIIQTEPELFHVTVTVSDDEGVILEGSTYVSVSTEQAAIDYAERVFLPDLRRNFKSLAGLKLSWEVSGNETDTSGIPGDA
jgi:hypothetical protein